MHLNKRPYGVGMVEVLVALVVIGIGMLGIAALYVTALQAKTTSLSRLKAITLANDLADRIRANRSGGTAYDTTVTTTPADKKCADTTTAAVDCNAADMASNDLFQWQSAITATGSLPGSAPSGSVSVVAGTATSPTVYTITINWSEPTAPNQSYQLMVQI